MQTFPCFNRTKAIHPSRAAGILILLFFFMLSPGLSTGKAEKKPAAVVNCDIHQHACTQPLSGGTGSVTLDISPKPVKAMTDLLFSVRLTDAVPATAPYVDLGMPGMKMGPNRVQLKPAPDGTYTGSGVIVRCPSGRTLWEAIISVPGAGTAAFQFNAVY